MSLQDHFFLDDCRVIVAIISPEYILTYTFFINGAILNLNLCLFESVEIWICSHWRIYICIESLPKHFKWCFRPSDREKKGHIQNC